jgi:hypothetical protein
VLVTACCGKQAMFTNWAPAFAGVALMWVRLF